MKCRVVPLFFIFLFLAAARQTAAQTDHISQWLPRVGDIYAYHFTYAWTNMENRGRQDDSLTLTVSAVTRLGDSAETTLIAFSRVFTSGQPILEVDTARWTHRANSFPLAISLSRPDEWLSQSSQYFDFADGRDTSYLMGQQRIHGRELIVSPTTVFFSPDVRWFGYIREWDASAWVEDMYYDYFLGAAILSSSGVVSNGVNDHLPASYDMQLRSLILEGENPKLTAAHIKLFDQLGRNVRTWTLSTPARYRIVLQADDLPSGIYFVSVEAGGSTQVSRIQVVR